MEEFLIYYGNNFSRLALISWRDLPTALAKNPATFRGRLVLVGGDLAASGDDVHRIPGRPGRAEIASGLALQALQVNTTTAGRPVRKARAQHFLLGASLWAGLAAVSGPLALVRPQAALAVTQEPVALVFEVTGEARESAAGRPAEPVHLFDWIPAGAIVETARGSRLALAFASGHRFELGELSRVKIGKKGFLTRAGKVRALQAVPPFPSLSPIAAEDHPGLRAGAIQIRGERMTGLYPRQGATALANETVLHFHSVAGARTYQVEIRDRRGEPVFEVAVASPQLKVPAGRLHSGLTYLWTILTLDQPGAAAHGEAELVSLDEPSAQAREEARRILAAEGPGSLPLLFEIDRSLGLWLEARDDLRAALDDKPGDPVLRETLAEIEARLEPNDDRE